MVTAMLQKHAEENGGVNDSDKKVLVSNETTGKSKKPAKPQYKKPAPTVASSSNKDPPIRPSSAPPTVSDAYNVAGSAGAKPKTSTSQSSHTTPNTFNKEALEILREMNRTINKTNEKVEAITTRVDNLSSEMDLDEDDQNYDYDFYYDNSEQDEQVVAQPQVQEEINQDDEISHNVFSKFSKIFKKSDITSDPVDDNLVEIVNEAFREGMSEDTFQAMNKEIHRPINCDSLKETKVNSAVWSVLRQHTQTEDSKLRGIQNCMVKATCNIVKVLEKEANKFEEKSLDMAMNAIWLLGQGNRWLNSRRKEYHKRDMDPRLHHLCSASTSFTDQLYGDSIVKDIKDIQETNKISRNVGGRFGTRRIFRGGARHMRGRRVGPYHTRRGYVRSFNSNFQSYNQSRASKNGQKGAENKN